MSDLGPKVNQLQLNIMPFSNDWQNSRNQVTEVEQILRDFMCHEANFDDFVNEWLNYLHLLRCLMGR